MLPFKEARVPAAAIGPAAGGLRGGGPIANAPPMERDYFAHSRRKYSSTVLLLLLLLFFEHLSLCKYC